MKNYIEALSGITYYEWIRLKNSQGGEITMDKEFVLHIMTENAIFYMACLESGVPMFSQAPNLAMRFTRERAEKLKNILRKQYPNHDIRVGQLRIFD